MEWFFCIWQKTGKSKDVTKQVLVCGVKGVVRSSRLPLGTEIVICQVMR
jgi:hypothetical protein